MVIFDLSHYHPVKDWSKIKSASPFIITKATQGTTFVDSYMDTVIKKCEALKIPYWLYAFMNVGNELAQAKFLVKTCKPKVGKYFVGYVLDFERDNNVDNSIKALEYIQQNSTKTMIYTAHHKYDRFKRLINARGDNCAWWEPRYTKGGGNVYSSNYPPHSGVELHQFTESYTASYLSGNNDANRLTGKRDLDWFLTPVVKKTVVTTVKKAVDVATTTDPIEKITKIAKDEVGYLEKKSNKNLDDKLANAGDRNYTKYGKWIGMNGDYWCASFLSWIFYRAFGTANGKKLLCGSYSAACETIRQNFKKKGQYKTSPKAGDVIFFKGTRHSGANHIGFVYKIADGKVYTIEGNTSGASGVIDNGGGVAKKSYATTYSKILGYGRPDYTIVGGKASTSTSTSTPTTTAYYSKYTGKSQSLVDALKVLKIDSSFSNRSKIAAKNGIKNYSGTASENTKLLKLLKSGKLKK